MKTYWDQDGLVVKKCYGCFCVSTWTDCGNCQFSSGCLKEYRAWTAKFHR